MTLLMFIYIFYNQILIFKIWLNKKIKNFNIWRKGYSISYFIKWKGQFNIIKASLICLKDNSINDITQEVFLKWKKNNFNIFEVNSLFNDGDIIDILYNYNNTIFRIIYNNNINNCYPPYNENDTRINKSYRIMDIYNIELIHKKEQTNINIYEDIVPLRGIGKEVFYRDTLSFLDNETILKWLGFIKNINILDYYLKIEWSNDTIEIFKL